MAHGDFHERLAERVRTRGTRLCVGIDPILEDLPPALHAVRDRSPGDALARFSIQLIDATAEHAACMKFQVAHFERLGSTGYHALEAAVRHARQQGLLVIADAKRADIGSTAAAYARYLLGSGEETFGDDSLDADAVTLQPYLGRDSVDPFLAHPGKGVFVLVRTSNPSGDALQRLRLADGRELYQAVLEEALSWEPVEERERTGYGRVGLVAGATDPEALARIRAAAPRSWLLVPGVGAQGAGAAAVAGAFDASGLGAIVNASRSIGFAYRRSPEGTDRTEAAAVAAAALRQELQDALPSDPEAAVGS